jgi:mRNA interferase RelE/StbE
MYNIRFSEKFTDSLINLPTALISKVKNKTNWLSANAEILNHQMLKGDEFKNIFKLRIGDYRILYDLDRANKTITFIKIGHRKDIYKF